MSTGQWVRLLTEDGLTMEMVAGQHQYIPCRAERNSPNNDWTVSWRLCRLPGLGSDLITFNFKLLHGLLVTRQRLHHLTPAATAACSHCQAQVEEDLPHALVDCSYNNGAGQALFQAVQVHVPELTVVSLLRLELPSLEADDELCIVTMISAILQEIWSKRLTKSRIHLYDIRATLEARCLLLRKSRLESNFESLTSMINNL